MINKLFSEIATVVPTINGWCSVDKATLLASIIVATRPKVVCEVGIFAGKSAVPMALALKHVGTGKLTAIDAWSNELAVKDEVKQHAEWWGKVDMDAIYNEFIKHLDMHGLNAFVEVFRGNSSKVTPPSEIGLLHVDGSHTDKAIDDVERYASNVIKGGFVVMDDCGWAGGGVRRACDVLTEEMNFRQLFHHFVEGTDDFAVFQKL